MIHLRFNTHPIGIVGCKPTSLVNEIILSATSVDILNVWYVHAGSSKAIISLPIVIALLWNNCTIFSPGQPEDILMKLSFSFLSTSKGIQRQYPGNLVFSYLEDMFPVLLGHSTPK